MRSHKIRVWQWDPDQNHVARRIYNKVAHETHLDFLGPVPPEPRMNSFVENIPGVNVWFISEHVILKKLDHTWNHTKSESNNEIQIKIIGSMQ